MHKILISLGAGVQSSTMALMAKRGELTPMPEGAIFADTQAEPKAVYEYLDWLEKQLPFPVYRVTEGNLGEEVLVVKTSKSGNKYTKHGLPVFTLGRYDKKIGMMQRQCTQDFKIVPIKRKIRELVGRKGTCEQWIGISLDEVVRMKPSRVKYITNRWPLIEKRITRQGCLNWMEANGYPKPPRSACVFCPFHSNEEWLKLKAVPAEFDRAVKFEKDYQKATEQVTRIQSIPYLHNSCIPLNKVDFCGLKEPDLFQNECEGMCGV